MNIKLLLSAIIVPLSFSVHAENPESVRMFKLLDRNNDGFITDMEASSVRNLVNNWDSLDKNQNGSIDSNELAAMFSSKTYTSPEIESEHIGAAPND